MAAVPARHSARPLRPRLHRSRQQGAARARAAARAVAIAAAGCRSLAPHPPPQRASGVTRGGCRQRRKLPSSPFPTALPRHRHSLPLPHLRHPDSRPELQTSAADECSKGYSACDFRYALGFQCLVLALPSDGSVVQISFPVPKAGHARVRLRTAARGRRRAHACARSGGARATALERGRVGRGRGVGKRGSATRACARPAPQRAWTRARTASAPSPTRVRGQSRRRVPRACPWSPPPPPPPPPPPLHFPQATRKAAVTLVEQAGCPDTTTLNFVAKSYVRRCARVCSTCRKSTRA